MRKGSGLDHDEAHLAGSTAAGLDHATTPDAARMIDDDLAMPNFVATPLKHVNRQTFLLDAKSRK
jgi:hypothetical protein